MISAGVTAAAALAGAGRAIWSVVRLPAAVAMQPPAPTRYRSLFGAGSRPLSFLSQLTIMALRHLVRWPLRTALTALGTSFSVALLVTALFSYDSIDFMIDTVFFQTERQDATIWFSGDHAPGATADVERLPGVLAAEPFRSTSVIVRSRYRERNTAIAGLVPGADMERMIDTELRPVTPPSGGLMISRYLADILDVRRRRHGRGGTDAL